LLKNPPEPPEPIVLYVDQVIEGDSYADVSAGIPEVGGQAPAPTDIAPPVDTAPATGTVGTSGDTAATGNTAMSNTEMSNTAPVTNTTSAPPAAGETGCGVSRVSGSSAGAVWGLAWSLALWVTRRSRRRA
jgi:hypothetical protein